MLEKLRLVEERYLEMEARAAQPDLYADAKAAARLQPKLLSRVRCWRHLSTVPAAY